MNIDEIIELTLSTLKRVGDTEAVVGKPLVTEDGMVVLPVNRVSYGFVTGGGEYGTEGAAKRPNLPHALGCGGGITVTPIGFLLCGKDKKFIAVDKEEPTGWKDVAKAALRAVKGGDKIDD